MPTKGLAYTKHALNQSFCSNWEEQLAIEDKYQQKAADTEDYKEGINSFLEKRNPLFKGK
jgi:2-(1,2-epoxy-1,2-dihydrophenyl)acetyl-CoA isomerase